MTKTEARLIAGPSSIGGHHDDNGAISKAKFIATRIAIDTPQLNQRHVAVLNDAGDEIFQAPIRSKTSVS